MSTLRLKGIDVGLKLVGPSGPIASVTKVGKFDLTFLAEILTEHYVEHPSPEFDEIDEGVDVKFSFHVHSPETFKFVDTIIKRRRREAFLNAKFSALGTYRFADTGRIIKVMVPDLKFGPLPFGVQGRKSYLHVDIDAKATQAVIVV